MHNTVVNHLTSVGRGSTYQIPAFHSFYPEIPEILLRTIQSGENLFDNTVIHSLTFQFILSYNATISGPSGNITVNGTLTCGAAALVTLSKRGIGAGNQTNVDLNTPPYAIHNGS
jgi:hypothetical protein